MEDEMGQSESIGALAGALAKAQGAMNHAAKGSLNPHFKNRYADLASVLDACRAELAANGIAVLQPVKVEGKVVTVSTVLAEDGAYETAIIDVFGAHPVERYEFLWQAEAGHERWLAFSHDCGFKRVTRLGDVDGVVMPVEIMLFPPTLPPWPFENEDEGDE